MGCVYYARPVFGEFSVNICGSLHGLFGVSVGVAIRTKGDVILSLVLVAMFEHVFSPSSDDSIKFGCPYASSSSNERISVVISVTLLGLMSVRA